MYDVVIIGAGVVGGLVARTLAKYDLRLAIVDKENDVAMGATKANSAIVHAGFDAKEGSLKAKLNVRGSQMMVQVCRELGVKYQNNGSLVIGFDGDDRAAIEELFVRGTANGVERLQVLDGEQTRALEPMVSSEVTCALYAPTGAIVCPYELAVAAIGNAMDNGADLRLRFEVTRIEADDEGYTLYSGTDSIRTRAVVNCAGLYSDAVAAMAGDRSFAVHPRRGEYLLLDNECGQTVSHTIFRTPSKMGKGILVSPTVDGNLLLGPTSVDMEDKDDRRTTADGLAQVMQKAKEYVPAVPLGKVITSFCGLRAVGSTGDFIINAPRKGFINAAGVESPGLSSAPAIGEYVAQLLVEQGIELNEKADFDPIRPATHAFREATIEEKNEIIKKDPAYGRIVCRCEGVTEGEILEAIRRNPKATDLDSVKRRTRAQMGRCQGGFCSPVVMELLAREQGIAYEGVTKCGGESRVVIGKTKGVE